MRRSGGGGGVGGRGGKQGPGAERLGPHWWQVLRANLGVKFAKIAAVQLLVRTQEATVFALADLGEARGRQFGHEITIAPPAASSAAGTMLSQGDSP